MRKHLTEAMVNISVIEKPNLARNIKQEVFEFCNTKVKRNSKV